MARKRKASDSKPADEHRAEHRPGQTTALTDWLGEPIAPVAERRSPGRPPVTLADDAVDAAVEALRAGVPETRIARALGVNFRTWQRLREEDDRLADAGAEARKIEEEELVAILMGKARKGEVVPLLFALKGRHGYRDQGAPPAHGGSRTNIVINLPASMTPDEYSKLIDVTPEREEEKSKKGIEP